jgi:cytochrome c oxidase accessory protein FixG
MANAPGHPGDFRSVMASVDHNGRRQWLYVHLVMGAWRIRRIALALLLIGFYLALPYLTIGGYPALLLDIQKRQFTVAGTMFWPQDFSYLLLLVLIFVVGTALLVALVGRFFCGWLCPHNVFLETIYRPLERLFEGPAVKRMNRAKGKIGGHWRKYLSWIGYLAISALLASTMTMLFTGPQAFSYGLWLDVMNYPSAAIFYAIATGLILFNFAWFREQTCTIVCPYGRLQSAMLDPHSLVVAYDTKRGDPRGKPGAVTSAGVATGDCVDCGLCVKVCPTGIDIRNGNQMECIHCTACIDVCNDVMSTLQRPPNLIGFRSEIELAGNKRNIFRLRTIIYSILLIAFITLFVVRISLRTELQSTVLRSGILPVATQNEKGIEVVRQLVKISLINRTNAAKQLTLSLPEALNAVIVMTPAKVELPANSKTEIMPVIDVPSTFYQAGAIETRLTFYERDGVTHTLPITLQRP